MAVNRIAPDADRSDRPRLSLVLPAEPEVDDGSGWVHYDAVADELMVYVGPAPVPAISRAIETPERDYVYVRIGGPINQLVGIQVDGFRAWAVERHPAWTALGLMTGGMATVGEEQRSALRALYRDVGDLVVRYGVR